MSSNPQNYPPPPAYPVYPPQPLQPVYQQPYGQPMAPNQTTSFTSHQIQNAYRLLTVRVGSRELDFDLCDATFNLSRPKAIAWVRAQGGFNESDFRWIPYINGQDGVEYVRLTDEGINKTQADEYFASLPPLTGRDTVGLFQRPPLNPTNPTIVAPDAPWQLKGYVSWGTNSSGFGVQFVQGNTSGYLFRDGPNDFRILSSRGDVLASIKQRGGQGGFMQMTPETIFRTNVPFVIDAYRADIWMAFPGWMDMTVWRSPMESGVSDEFLWAVAWAYWNFTLFKEKAMETTARGINCHCVCNVM